MKITHYAFVLLTAILLTDSALGQTTDWKTNGNANLNPNCFIGTTDQTPVKIKVNGTTQLKVKANGKVKMSSLAGTGRSYISVADDGTLFRQDDPGLDSLFDCSTKLWKANGNYLTPDCFIGSTNQEALRMLTHNQERMRIAQNGHVGIGTASPKGIFQIGDYMPLAVSVRQNGPSDTRYMLGFNAYLDGTTSHFSHSGPAGMINWDVAYSDICINVASPGSAGQTANFPIGVAVGQNGRVGIGTRDQEALLHLRKAGGAADLRIESGDPLAAPSLEFWAGPFGNTSAKLGEVRAAYNSANGLSELKFEVNGGVNPSGTVQVLQIDKDNAELSTRLGIGTAPNSADRLTVGGAVRFTDPNASANFIRLHHNGTDAVLEHETASANSNATNRLRINPSGNRTEFGGDVVLATNLGLGTDDFHDPTNGRDYRLSVDGHVRARSVKVYSGWADHVFEQDYRLAPLSEVEAYIEKNGCLPGLPSAAEVAVNGADVGETQALLLEKIEELTLHLIKLEKENESLKAEMEGLKK